MSLSSVDNADWPYATIADVETWQDGTCAWSSRYTNSGYYGSYSDGWMIQVGEQSLQIDRLAWCGGLREATLDGVTYGVDADTWAAASDLDGDGAEGAVDCDDSDPTRSPCLVDVVCDGIDNDCDGADASDADGDGHDAECAGGDDCDDAASGTHPGARDHPYDGIDQDCDGADALDGDGDGLSSISAGGDDCDDADPWIFPGARETYCDGIDQDCDGEDWCPEEPAPWDEDDMPLLAPGCRWNGSASLLVLLVTFRHTRRRGARPSPRLAPP